MAPKGGPVKTKPVGQAYKDKSKPADVRTSNISAAKGKKMPKLPKNSIKNVPSYFRYEFSTINFPIPDLSMAQSI